MVLYGPGQKVKQCIEKCHSFGSDRCSIRVNINSLWPSDAIRRQGTESTLAELMLLPDGTKPLHEPMLTCHQLGPMAFIGGHNHEI